MINVINLGAGVQSSTMALMAAKGEITPMPDCAIFADTQAEPDSVYEWLDWLEKELPFPVYRVTRGSLTERSLTPAVATSKAKNYEEGEEYMKRIIPMFGKMPDGEVVAALGRSCTADYKIRPIEKKIEEIANIKRGEKDLKVTQWIGISYDEIQRMKESRKPWTQLRYPLIELQMHRHHCKQWMKKNGYPEPPRSACYYCPFHSDEEWRRLRNEEPKYFKEAIKFDAEIRELSKKDRAMKMEAYLHRSCKPLGEIDFDSDEDKGQQTWDFMSECEGMCGV
jgi:3'-phosphoadenosine 5'-phosphosulfate sulfotransferase (PAPS reductase)/FAD synthetase